ncbi:hypothetical protein ABZ319_10655 [Nocardia sp. NPDC005978]|uniref:hypothetical protein n=1 Tax=Nocardia sp. NPDC005978 TaxID=3156725 RepID=UPI0033BDDD88
MTLFLLDGLYQHFLRSALEYLDKRFLGDLVDQLGGDLLQDRVGDESAQHSGDSAEKPLTESAESLSGRHENARLESGCCRSGGCRPGQFRDQPGSGDVEIQFGGLQLVAHGVGGTGERSVVVCELLERALVAVPGAVSKWLQPSQNSFTADTSGQCAVDTVDESAEIVDQVVDLFGDALQIASHLPHEIFVAVRPVGSDDPLQPFQPRRKLECHGSPQTPKGGRSARDISSGTSARRIARAPLKSFAAYLRPTSARPTVPHRVN